MTTRASVFLMASILLCLPGRAGALEPHQCAASLESLKVLAADASFPLRWEEASMSDGKPLIISILEKDGLLFLEFVKTREGLWAEGAATICRGSAGLEVRFGHLRMGPAAHWILRLSEGRERIFGMSRQARGHLQLATPGWSGAFVPKPN
ncbi:MAG TPA: hypothetical protein VLI46_14905 [Ramlibacter sp.]|nr:hypothetical protein [Ramlibacter sp.]